MKHKKIFEKVRQLIDERELEDENLETARNELFALVEAPPVGVDWLHEVKHHGYCVQLIVQGGKARLYSDQVKGELLEALA